MFNDFTFEYLKRAFEIVKDKFALRLLGTGLGSTNGRPQLYLRHDVDVSVKRALMMAEFEADCGVMATYMFIPNSRLYDLRGCRDTLRRLNLLGHEVALHFDVDGRGREMGANIQDVHDEIEEDCRKISEITGDPVRSVSFHRPMPQFIGGDPTVCGRINAYAAALMGCYISDSKGQWRSGDPVQLLHATAEPVVQLLIHPIWYGTNHMDPQQRLEEFFLSETRDLIRTERSRFDADLAFTVPGVRRANYEAV
jgi:hypothetical protein